MDLIDLSLFFDKLDSFLFALAQGFKLDFSQFHNFPLLMPCFLSFVILCNTLLNPLNVDIGPDDILEILKESRFISITRFLFHLWNLLNFSLEDKKPIIVEINSFLLQPSFDLVLSGCLPIDEVLGLTRAPDCSAQREGFPGQLGYIAWLVLEDLLELHLHWCSVHIAHCRRIVD